MADLFGFLSTPSVRRATGFHHGMRCAAKISIHALREEGDDGLLLLAFALEQFLSTPSVRRATRFQALPQGISRHFYPRPPRGGRRVGVFFAVHFIISIHALREEGDKVFGPFFLLFGISIHALREEGDSSARWHWRIFSDFYPRPPRGGRPAKRAAVEAAKRISIHALREEGDRTGTAGRA